MTWHGGNEEQEECKREALPTPKVLQEHLNGWCGTTTTTTIDVRSPPLPLQAAGGGGIGTANVADDARRSSDALGKGKGPSRPRLILRGMAPGFLRVLLDSPLGIDAEFVEAHATRRRYHQPFSSLHRRRHLLAPANFVAAAQWNYPELVSGFGRAMWSRKRGDLTLLPSGDGMGKAVVRAVSDREDLAAVECRVSVWVADKVDVLFLDLPVWEKPGTLLMKGRRRRMDVTMMEGDEAREKSFSRAEKEKVEEEEEEEIPSLEDVVLETLSLSAEAEGRKLVDILEEAAYNKWLDFFEVLTPRQRPSVAAGVTSLEWRALQALEGNADMARRLSLDRQHAPPPSQATTYNNAYPDWSFLLQRLRDRVALLATVPPPMVAHLPPPSVHRRKGEKPRALLHADNFTNLPIPPRRRAKSPLPPAKGDSGGGSGSDYNQRALDRVTYLGGLLLPISITTSVLSMNESFEPGQRLFWVFWAVAVPLTVVTFVVIYADKLRSSEVWEDLGFLGSSGSVLGEENAETEAEEAKAEKMRMRMRMRKEKERIEMHEGKAEYEESGRLATRYDWTRAGDRHRQSEAVRPPAMDYAGQDEIVIDLGDVVAQPAEPIALEPRTSQQQQEQPDQDMGPRPPFPPSLISFDRPSANADDDEEEAEEEEDDDDGFEDDEVMDPNMYITHPSDGTRPHAWRKKQLGWGGAAKCMLGVQRPLRVEDGLPDATELKRDSEKRLRQGRRRASAEGRRPFSH